MAAQWAPHSHLLGVEDHVDGHISTVCVFEISGVQDSPLPDCRLVFESPDSAYDVQWFIQGWDASRRIIHLRRDEIVHAQNGKQSFISTKKSFVMGTAALKARVYL